MFEGNHEQQYRERTRRTVKSASRVMAVTFMCRKCKTPKPHKGRVMRVAGWPEGGYLCAGGRK